MTDVGPVPAFGGGRVALCDNIYVIGDEEEPINRTLKLILLHWKSLGAVMREILWASCTFKSLVLLMVAVWKWILRIWNVLLAMSLII